MKRTFTTLAKLNYGDAFYIFRSKERVVYYCRSWSRPDFRYGYKKWYRKYLWCPPNAKSGILHQGSGNLQVVKIEKVNA